MDNEILIEVCNLSKRFGAIRAVDNLSLTVYRGDIYGLLGPNGSGKSTTIRMLLSLISPDKGDISVFGLPLQHQRRKILRRVGALVEKPDFYEYLSAAKNLKIALGYAGLPPDRKRIEEALATAGLSDRASGKVGTFSKGMKQRLGIAQAMISDPDLVILDEPSSGLDPAGIKEVRELILHLNRDMGKTILLSSHNLHEIELIANRMILIDKGKKIVENEVKVELAGFPFRLVVETDEPEKAHLLLKDSPVPLPGLHSDGTRLVMTADANTAAIVNKMLVENGIGVRSLAHEKSLEQYFLNRL